MAPKKGKDSPILSEAYLSLVLEMLREQPETRLTPKSCLLGLDLGDTLRYGELQGHLKRMRSERRMTMARAARTLGVRMVQ
jgi:hypothetical protein